MNNIKLKKIFPNKIRSQLFAVYVLTFTAIIVIISSVLIVLLSRLENVPMLLKTAASPYPICIESTPH